MLIKRSRGMLAACLSVMTVIIGSGTAGAADCRTIASVQRSADPANNNASGGHINQHILGQVPPPGTSQTGKTLFTSRDEYIGIWRNYQASSADGMSVNCVGENPSRSVSVQVLMKKPTIGIFSCTAADDRGLCTAKTKGQRARVMFRFAYVGNQWILNTAYPTD